jgi:hypothetical protein
VVLSEIFVSRRAFRARSVFDSAGVFRSPNRLPPYPTNVTDSGTHILRYHIKISLFQLGVFIVRYLSAPFLSLKS